MSESVNLHSNAYLNARLGDSLNYFLIEISGKIQLTPTQRQKAAGHYEAIANVLKNSPEQTLLNKLDVKMIPFGGLGTNTATKPFQGDEFDLDLIVKFLTQIQTFKSAENLYFEVYNALKANDVYKDKLEPMDRCIRLYYSGEFYLDLMPAVLYFDPRGSSTKLLIPEKQKNGQFELEVVDPIGLMNWFERKCDLQQSFDSVKNLSERGDFEIMPLITDDAKKPALKQAVQLLKRTRDVYFAKDNDAKKILKSVVILTTAGNVYSGERNLYGLVEKIIDSIDEITLHRESMSLTNPMNDEENFLESLRNRPDRHEKLRAFIHDFKIAWALLSNPNKDFPEKIKLLSKLFGESVTQSVMTEYGTRMHEANVSGKMKMANSGVIGVSSLNTSLKVPRHQFYGDK